VRIAVISVAPVFPEIVIGGSQKILSDIAIGLKNSGHEVQIWCTGTETHRGDFDLSGVTVHPDLKLRGSFPATHHVSPAALANTADVLREAADWANRLYLHADAVYLRHAIEGTQIVRSIHDYVYEEALLSTLLLPADTTVVPSEYLKNCVEATVALTGKKSIEPVVVIQNGVQVPDSLPAPALPTGIDARAENDLILLFPHRPEPTKGIPEAISTAVEVQRLDPARKVRLLIPAYAPEANLDDAVESGEKIMQLATEMGARNIVELHGWLSPADMPGYYAAGDVTLCVGSFVESFGLVPVESVANGTPAVCARVGALRQFDDIAGITLVPYGDIDANARAVQALISTTPETIESGRTRITEKYSSETMISEFESMITHALSAKRNISTSGSSRLTLAPWCDIQGERIYDDYAATAKQFPELTRALQQGDGFVQSDPLLLSASLDAEVRYAKESGFLIPEFVFE
jgi:glycosyltransferase involved in cell wall biosynthesis